MHLPDSIEGYKGLLERLSKLSEEERRSVVRYLCRNDLYYLLRYAFNRKDVQHSWLFDRCREVQNTPNSMLDLWSREHYKSSLLTFALSIQNILQTHGEKAVGQECTIGIFSHTRPIAKAFLRQIKRELESNQMLIALFPDILWENASREASSWSEDSGIIVKRSGNPKESSVEAHGLVDGMPTSKHYTHLIYDDVVTQGSVTSPEMRAKTLEALELSYSLGAQGGIRRMIGTRYHLFDAYAEVMKRGSFTPRIYPATENGEVDGEPVLLSKELLAEKRRDQGAFVFGAQMLQNPQSEMTDGFERNWLQYWKHEPTGGNRYILVDPANAKKKKSDFTAVWVLECREDRNIYAIDLYRQRLSLTERADLVFKLVKHHRPLKVVYEEYGMQADIQHIQDRQERNNFRFTIIPVGGKLSKNERIRRLIPWFEQGRVYFPEHIDGKTDDGRKINLIDHFVQEEFLPFPVCNHDDMLDSLSRFLDAHIEFPDGSYTAVKEPEFFPTEFSTGFTSGMMPNIWAG